MTTDETLLGDLKRILDAVDGTHTVDGAAAKAVFELRDLDGELAQLVFDSAVDEREGELVMRGAADDLRTLSFSTDDVSIDLELGEGRIVGQLTPALPASVEIHRAGREVVTVEVDEFGMFIVDDATSGPVSLACRAADGSWAVRTAWTIT